jgi:hypothetical protein
VLARSLPELLDRVDQFGQSELSVLVFLLLGAAFCLDQFPRRGRAKLRLSRAFPPHTKPRLDPGSHYPALASALAWVNYKRRLTL